MTRILAISGSLRDGSLNATIVRMAVALAPAGVEVEIAPSIGEFPHFSPDLDGDDPPAPVRDLRLRIQNADALLICTPEYAHGMPGSLKNMLDWLVSSPVVVGKRVAVWSASPSAEGGARAHAALAHTLKVISTDVVEAASLIIPFARMKLHDDETREAVRAAVAALVVGV